MKLSELAVKIGSRLENCTEDVDISAVSPIEEAGPGEIAYVSSLRELVAARSSKAAAVICPNGVPPVSMPMLRGEDPYLLFARVLEVFHCPFQYETTIHPTAVIHPLARIGPNASIGPYVVIDQDVEIGCDATLLPHVVIYRGARIGNNFLAHAHAVVREYCRLGDNVVLQNGAVIGSDGFGFVKEQTEGQITCKKVMHPGAAVLDDDVEVQANACVNRSDNGETRIKRGVKIGDLVHIGHKSTVEENTMVLPQVGLAGRTQIGRNVTLLGQSGVAGYCEVGDGAVVMAKSGVINNIPAGKEVSGFPAIDHRSFLRSFATFKRLPTYTRNLRKGACVAPKGSSGG
jgi:UDP-3-O-[3-hydroxymyristoyl] glucosamine N-acyltransferase